MKVEAFPSNDIPTLVELAIDVVAENYTLYPSLDGVEEDHVRKEVRLAPPKPKQLSFVFSMHL